MHMLASLVLGFTMLDTLSRFVAMWLHPTPMWPCLDVTIRDALPWCRLLHAYLSLFFFFCSAQFYAYHACLCHSLAFYASLHACLHVHPWVLFASVSSMLQYNEVIDVQSKPTFFPRGHQLLFSFLLVCLFACLLDFWFLCLPCLSCLSYLLYVSFICILHLFLPSLVCWFLVYCLSMYTPRARMHRARARSPRHKRKGQGRKHVIWAKWR